MIKFKGLYGKRWGVETYFDWLKNLLEVERFSSRKVVGIEQDFYEIVFLSTLASVLMKEEEEAEEELRTMLQRMSIPEQPGRRTKRPAKSTSRQLRFLQYVKRIWA